MYAVFYTMVMVLLWVINLFNGTGYGMTYHTTEISMIAAVVVGVICLASQSLKDGDVMIKPRYFYTIMPLTVLIRMFTDARISNSGSKRRTIWAVMGDVVVTAVG